MSKTILVPTTLLAAGLAGAATIEKADNLDDLQLGSCWIGGVAPGPGDIATFDLYPTKSYPRSVMMADLDWGGIVVTSNNTIGANVGAPFDVFTQLTLGSDGVDIQAPNKSVLLGTDLLLSADQEWTGVEGAAVSILGTYRQEGSYLDLGGHQLTLSVPATINGGNPAPYEIRNGSILVQNGARLRVTSGKRPTGTSPDPILTVGADVSFQVDAGSALAPYDSALSVENLVWEAAVILNGGVLEASGYQGFGFGLPATSNSNTVGGTIEVIAPSSIELSSEIGSPRDTTTLHRITAPITGSTTLFLRNASKTVADNRIVLAGDNSGFAGNVVLDTNTADGLTSGVVRLSGDDAGSPGTWSLASGNTLEIETSSVSLGSLAGPGTVRAVGIGASTLTVGGGSFSGTVTQAHGAILHYRKVGTGTHTPSGTPGWNGDTQVDGGKLSLSDALLPDDREVRIAGGAVLRLTHGATDTVARLFLGGIEQAAGTHGAVGSGADHESAFFEGSGMLEVLAVPAAYDAWIASFATLTDPADRDPDADPDGDGKSNFMEFACAGDPTTPADAAWEHLSEVSGNFRLVVAVRAGAAFAGNGGELVSAPIDGVIYRIQASPDLADFLSTEVLEVGGFTPPPGLPALPAGWEYRAFESGVPLDGSPRQFMRGGFEPAL